MHNDNSIGRIRDAMVFYWGRKKYPLKFATLAPYGNQHLHFISFHMLQFVAGAAVAEAEDLVDCG